MSFHKWNCPQVLMPLWTWQSKLNLQAWREEKRYSLPPPVPHLTTATPKPTHIDGDTIALPQMNGSNAAQSLFLYCRALGHQFASCPKRGGMGKVTSPGLVRVAD